MEKKEYVKPEVVAVSEIEALSGQCEIGGNTGQDKVSYDPGTGICLNPMT